MTRDGEEKGSPAPCLTNFSRTHSVVLHSHEPRSGASERCCPFGPVVARPRRKPDFRNARRSGRVLGTDDAPPADMLTFIAAQIGCNPDEFAAYAPAASEGEKRPIGREPQHNLPYRLQFGGVDKAVLSDDVNVAEVSREAVFIADA